MYFYDGLILLAEKVGSQIRKIYINNGTGITGIVRPIYNASNTLTHYQRLYYMYDSLGSVSVITNELGVPVQQYTYSPYGSTMNVDYDPINNLRFVGRYGGYKDDDTGLTYFWHRWYDEGDGRWVSRDPLNIKGGLNLFMYTANNPVFWIDANGLVICGGKDAGYPYHPSYGNWGGAEYSGGCKCPYDWTKDKPGNYQDDMDGCFKAHDFCSYEHGLEGNPERWCDINKMKDKEKCDKQLCQCLKGLSDNPLVWNKKPKNFIWAIIYRSVAIRYFCK